MDLLGSWLFLVSMEDTYIEDVPVRYIIREIVVFTVSVVGVTFIGLIIFFLLAFVWTKIKKDK